MNEQEKAITALKLIELLKSDTGSNRPDALEVLNIATILMFGSRVRVTVDG